MADDLTEKAAHVLCMGPDAMLKWDGAQAPAMQAMGVLQAKESDIKLPNNSGSCECSVCQPFCLPRLACPCLQMPCPALQLTALLACP